MAVEDILVPAAGRLLHRPDGTGDMYWGPGDLYRFLVTGAETGGAYFAMEAIVPPGGGPPPHIHTQRGRDVLRRRGTVLDPPRRRVGSPPRPATS